AIRGQVSTIRLKKIVLIAIGFVSLGIGILGIVLPVLPGGPFFLFALFCFTKGSKRMEQWFKGTSLYHKYVLAFLQKKGLTRKEKIRINLIADTAILISLITIDNLFVRIVLIALALYK